ncbi:MAG: 6-carboxytetrahydropterin synthase, partial [Candidatus Sumerlaeales bacterium]|nr:6-carboxytetrahydropterin synthase [Candidatus Sumerlaeales bacterium]
MSSKILYITRRAEFAASHRLKVTGWDDNANSIAFGKCANLHNHGHTYTIELTVAGTPDETTGMLMDLTELKKLIQEHIINHVDHKNLNEDVPWLQGINPTAENLCVEFWKRIQPYMPAHV